MAMSFGLVGMGGGDGIGMAGGETDNSLPVMLLETVLGVRLGVCDERDEPARRICGRCELVESLPRNWRMAR